MTSNTIYKVFLIVLFTFSYYMYAQTTMHSYYDFAASWSSGAYTELTSPTVLVESGGDDFSLTNGGSGYTGPGYPIGFNFYFNGEYFTRFGINSNGFIGLGTEADGVNLTSNLSNPISYTGTISPSRLRSRIVAFGNDITHNGSIYSPAISYSTLGTSPNRILVIQFKGWRRYGTDFTTDIINFQIRLYETSHKIEIIYGSTSAATTSSQIEVGHGGKNTTEYYNLTTTNNWASPSTGSTVDAKMTFGAASRPTDGTTYTWTLRTQIFSSATTEQASTNFLLKGQTNQQIIRLKILTNGWVFPFSVTSITFTTNGTTTLGNLTAARVYYTNSDNFSTTTQFGSTINSPSGTLTFNGSQQLGTDGVHSFWLVYYISSSATTGSQYVDGTCVSFTTNETGNPTRSPSVTDPAGNRQILGALSGTITVGDGGDYPTLTGTTISTGLFTAINNLGLSGNLTVNILSDITETGFTALNQWTEYDGSGYTVTIQPASGSLKTISGSTTSSLIRLNGADRVTINGNYSGSGKYLKFVNTNSSPTAALNLQNGASNNNIKNCYFESDGNYGAIYSSTTGAVNENNLIENCEIKNYSGYPFYGIYFYTANNLTTYHNNNTIRNCKVYNFSNMGISVAGGINNIEGCEIYNNDGTGSTGIIFTNPTSVSSESVIKNNKIYDLNTSSSNIAGISCRNYGGTVTIYNNSISIEATTTGQVYGISIISDATYSATTNIYYNSVYITGSAGLSGNLSAGIYKSTSINTLRIKNNSIFNARTTTSGTPKNYAIYFGNTTITTADFNYNDYFVNGTNSYIGYWSSDRSTLADWQSASGEGANSISSNPLYVSSDNLKPFNTSPLISAGTPISGISTDIDVAARSGTNPYIGAYESSQVPVTVDFCNIQPVNSTIKEGQTSTFTALVEESGVTNSVGQGAGIQCWIGYSTSNTNPSTWTNWTQATYTGDVGDRDQYSAKFPASLTPGTYYVASRFFITNAMDYQYGGTGGEWNNNSSVLTIQDNTINFANVEHLPVSVKLGVNKKFYAMYGLPDVTNQSTQSNVVQAWIGYNTANTDPSTWSNWVSATFIGQNGSYHEYEASFGSSFNVGTYYYASRFKLNDDSYVYGGYSEGGGGIYNGTTNVNGTINVNTELPFTENFDNVTTPNLPNGWSKTASSPTWSTSGTSYNSSPYSANVSIYQNVVADAWLFSPPISLNGGSTYTVVFYAWHSNIFSGGKLNGKFGTSATAGGMTSSNVFDITTTTTKTRYSYTFTPSTTGTYYFGWHNYSVYYTSYPGPLCIDDVQIYDAPVNSSTQTIAFNSTSPVTFGSTGTTIKFDVANGQNITLNVDKINSNPGVNGSLPSGVNQIVSKYWNIAVTSGAISSGVYSISIDVSDILGVNNPKDLYLLKRTDSNAEWQNLGEPNLTEGNVCTWSGLTSFSEFTLGGDSENPLPVEINLFSASLSNNKVILNWQTATEVNNYGFEIERATENGKSQIENWEKIGFVAGHGNSNSPKDYSFVDDISAMSLSKCKYRLKQIDFDGKYEYSKVVEVTIDLPTKFVLEQNYPNPFNPTTTIKYSIPSVGEVRRLTDALPINVTMKVYDILGREVATLVNEKQSPGNYEVKFDGSKLANDVYLYRLKAGRFTAVKKFILVK